MYDSWRNRIRGGGWGGVVMRERETVDTVSLFLSVHQDFHLYQPGICVAGHAVWDHPSKSDQRPGLAAEHLCIQMYETHTHAL